MGTAEKGNAGKRKRQKTTQEGYDEQTTIVEYDFGVLHIDFWHDNRNAFKTGFGIFRDRKPGIEPDAGSKSRDVIKW